MINVNKSMSSKSDMEENVGTMLPQIGLTPTAPEDNEYLSVTTDISDLNTFITESSKVIDIIVENTIFEAKEIDLKKEYKYFKKNYAEHIKLSKKLIKNGQYSEAQKEIDACISLIIQIERRLDKSESPEEIDSLIGFGIMSALSGIKVTVTSMVPFIGVDCGSYESYKSLINDISKIRKDLIDEIKNSDEGIDPAIFNKYKLLIKTKLSIFRKNLEKYKAKIDKDFIRKEMGKNMDDIVNKPNKDDIKANNDAKAVLATEAVKDRDGDGEPEMSPEMKRMDELRGKVAELEDDLEKAKKRYDETGDSYDEKRVRGLTNKLAKAKEDLVAGEKKYNKEIEDLEKDDDDPVAEAVEDQLMAIRQRTIQLIKERNEASSIGQRMYLESAIIEEQKRYEKAKALQEGTINDMSVYTERANLDKEIEDIVDTFNNKGYKVKYASAGHTQLRKKADANQDGVYYQKLYSDARVMFDKKYDFDDTPKYWHLRDVDGCSYLDITPERYSEDDGTQEEAFNKWKQKYLYALRTFAKDLPPIGKKAEEKDPDEVVKESYDYMDNIIESMGLNDISSDTEVYESVVTSNSSVIDELNELLK